MIVKAHGTHESSVGKKKMAVSNDIYRCVCNKILNKNILLKKNFAYKFFKKINLKFYNYNNY